MAHFESAVETAKHLTGKTTDLSVQAHWLVLFENNEQPANKGGHKDDAELCRIVKAEFPAGKDYTEADIRMHRQLYLSGRLIALKRRDAKKGRSTAKAIHRYENGKVVPNRVNFKVETKKAKAKAPAKKKAPAKAKAKGKTKAKAKTILRKKAPAEIQAEASRDAA